MMVAYSVLILISDVEIGLCGDCDELWPNDTYPSINNIPSGLHYTHGNPQGENPYFGADGPCPYMTRYGNVYQSGIVKKTNRDLGDQYWSGPSGQYYFYNSIERAANSTYWAIDTLQFTCESGDPTTYDMDSDGVPDIYDCNHADNNVGLPVDPDQDGDGLSNDVDPWPEDGGYFQFKEVAQFLDENGDVVGRAFRFKNSLGEEKYMVLGETDDTAIQLLPDRNWMDGQIYIDTYADQGPVFTENDPTNPGGGGIDQNLVQMDTESPDLDGGNDNTGNSTETDYLEDIVANTKVNAENQQGIVDAITEVGNKVAAMGSRITGAIDSQTTSQSDSGGGEDGGTGDYEGPSAEEIGQAVSDSLTDNTGAPTFDGSNQELDDSYLDAQTQIIGDASLAEDAPEEFQEKTDISEEIEDIQNNSVMTGIRGVLEGTTVETSGSCSFFYDYKGTSVEFSVCDFQDELQTWGILMVSMVSLHSLLIVFRRG
jgi:hypothetical protein